MGQKQEFSGDNGELGLEGGAPMVLRVFCMVLLQSFIHSLSPHAFIEHLLYARLIAGDSKVGSIGLVLALGSLHSSLNKPCSSYTL